MNQISQPGCGIDVREIEKAANRLLEQVRAINSANSDVDIQSIERFARICLEISLSQPDEIRDNIISAYALAARPIITENEIEYGYLLLDKYVNDVKDCLLRAEQFAANIGLPTAGPPMPVPLQILIPTNSFSNEISEIRASHTEIKTKWGT